MLRKVLRKKVLFEKESMAGLFIHCVSLWLLDGSHNLLQNGSDVVAGKADSVLILYNDTLEKIGGIGL